MPARGPALLVTRNLPPLRGGMERLVHRMAGVLAGEFELHVVGPDGCGRALPASTAVSEVPTRPLAKFLLRAAVASLKAARAVRPGLVLAGSGLTVPLAWLAARLSGGRLCVYLHGLDIVAPSLVYRAVWVPFLRRADLVLVNSQNTARLAVDRGVPARVVRLLHPGTELPPPAPQAGEAFRRQHALGQGPLLLSVGRLTPRKGIPEFIELGLPRLLQRYPDARLLVIGDDAVDALHGGAESGRSRVADAVRRAGLGDSVRLMEPCDDTELSAAYEAADVHVFPVREQRGDVEGFGMVAIEAAAHGLPTVAFAVGGVPDAVLEHRSGSLVEGGDYSGLADRIGEWIDRRHDAQVPAGCRKAAAEFGWDRFAARLLELLDENAAGRDVRAA